MKSSTIAALLALTLAGATPASAQIRFAGSTMGCFGDGCTPTLYSGADYLNFTGGTFDGISRNNGRLPLLLGSFSWDPFLGETWVDSPFTLFISFTHPTGITPEPVYYGNVEGLVIRGKLNRQWVGESSAQLVFEPNVRDYTFSGGEPNLPGEFTLTLADTYIEPNMRSHVIGEVSNAHVTPEPVSMILMGSGLAGLAAVRRRRKQQVS